MLKICINFPKIYQRFAQKGYTGDCWNTKASCCLRDIEKLPTSFNIAQHCRTLPNIAQHCPTLPNIAQHCPTLPNTAQHCPTSPDITQHHPTPPNTTKHQHTSTYISVHQHTWAYISTHPHTSYNIYQRLAQNTTTSPNNTQQHPASPNIA